MSTRTEVTIRALTIVVIAILLANAVDRGSARLQPRGRRIVAIALSLASLPALSFCFYYVHLLPEMQWLYRLRASPASDLALAIPLVAIVAWRTLLPRPVVVGGYAVAIALVEIPFAKPIVRPLDVSQLVDAWRGEACLQSTPSTCGPASAATVIRFLGRGPLRESTLAREAWSSASGTEAWYLARALRSHGYTAEFQFNRFPDGITLPGILGVKLDGFGHFIAVLARDDNRWTIADPLVGQEVVTATELTARYRLSGFFMHIE